MDFLAAANRLRGLTKERDAGTLAPAEYRRARGRVLDALVGLEPRAVDMEVTQPRSPSKASEAAQPSKQRELDTASNVPRSTRRGWLIGVFTLLAVAIVVATAMWLRAEHPRSESPPPELAVRAPAAAMPAVAESVDSVIADFLKRGDWGDKSVTSFNTAWWSLSDDEVVAVLGSAQGQELARQLAEQLQPRTRHDTNVAALDPSSPLLIMAGNLKVAIPQGAAESPPPALARDQEVERPSAAKGASSVRETAKAVDNPPAPANPSAADKPAASAKSANSAAAPVATQAAAGTEPIRAASSDPCAESNLPPRRRSCSDVLPDGRRGPTLRVVSAGHFMMGSTATPEEQPVHAVKIAQPFALMEGEVTAGEYAFYCQLTHKPRPAAPWDGDTLPVVNVSWSDARDYAAWLSGITGQQYRLPTEAEWEYAARAGASGEPGLDGAPALNPASEARYSTPSMTRNSPVSVEDSSYKGNAWGLRHMAGNVREWVEDGWTPDYSRASADGAAAPSGGTTGVARGGSFHDGATAVRPGARVQLNTGTRDTMTGFRLLRVIHSS